MRIEGPSADATVPTRFQRLRIARLNDGVDGVHELLAWAQQNSTGRDDEVRKRIATIVREYSRSDG